MKMVSRRWFLLLLFQYSGISTAFLSPSSSSAASKELFSSSSREEIPRRGFLSTAIVATWGGGVAAQAAQEAETRQGIPVTAFNGLIFNYRGGQFGGLEAEDLDEPSISYADFCAILQPGQVEFVEFLAPDGDVAYATLAAEKGQAKLAPIRIGEGYPIERHDGWSSPAFAVRTVKNAGVPYKFSVPGLAKYSTKS